MFCKNAKTDCLLDFCVLYISFVCVLSVIEQKLQLKSAPLHRSSKIFAPHKHLHLYGKRFSKDYLEVLAFTTDASYQS
jgi:hypothetical protein